MRNNGFNTQSVVAYQWYMQTKFLHVLFKRRSFLFSVVSDDSFYQDCIGMVVSGKQALQWVGGGRRSMKQVPKKCARGGGKMGLFMGNTGLKLHD